jgi:hypothetical protein
VAGSFHKNTCVCIYDARDIMENCALKNVDNCLNTNIYSYFETSVAKVLIYI